MADRSKQCFGIAESRSLEENFVGTKVDFEVSGCEGELWSESVRGRVEWRCRRLAALAVHDILL